MSIELVRQSNYFILHCPLLLLLSVFPSIRIFSKESAVRIRWPKYWSFSFSISPSNDYSCWFPFWIDWFELLAVRKTLKRLLEHHSSKTSVLQCSVFFMVQLSHPYMTTEKKHSFDYIDHCQQSDISAVTAFFQASFNFVAAVTVCSEFGAPENIWSYLYFSQQSWSANVSSNLVFHMMYSAYELNKQCDSIQPWWTPFPVLNQSLPCLF